MKRGYRRNNAQHELMQQPHRRPFENAMQKWRYYDELRALSEEEFRLKLDMAEICRPFWLR